MIGDAELLGILKDIQYVGPISSDHEKSQINK